MALDDEVTDIEEYIDSMIEKKKIKPKHGSHLHLELEERYKHL